MTTPRTTAPSGTADTRAQSHELVVLWTAVHTRTLAPPGDSSGDLDDGSAEMAEQTETMATTVGIGAGDGEAAGVMAGLRALHAMILHLQLQPECPAVDRRPAAARRSAARQFQQSSIDSPGDAEYTAPLPGAARRGMHNDSLGLDIHESAVQTAAAAQDAARAQAAAAFATRGSQDDILVARRMQVRAPRPVRERPESAI